jgi:glutamyl endopeptidase
VVITTLHWKITRAVLALSASVLLPLILAPAAQADSAASVPFGQPYAGTGNLADSQGVSFDAVAGLPAATSATSASPDAIIGTDNRTRVTTTTGFPWRAVVWIQAKNPAGQSFTCTGFLYGANAVATAGHCLYDRGNKGWNQNFVVIPGANGSSQPYGHCGASVVTTTTAYVNNGTTTEDYGAIKLNCSVGNTTGWFGFAYPANTSQTWRLTGYPCDKAAGTMWTATGQITKQNTAETDYNIDMAGCQSGSPVYNTSDQATAINAYGVGTSYNAGPSLTAARQSNLHSWA